MHTSLLLCPMMKTRSLLCLILTTSTISACQSLPRKFDGTLGYKVESRTDTVLTVSYTESAKKSAEKMQAGLLQVCAEELKQPANSIVLDVKIQKEFVQQVNMSVPVPLAMATTGGMTHGGKPGAPQSSLSGTEMNETVYRDMRLRRISADCRLK